jgi:hypothetical protein
MGEMVASAVAQEGVSRVSSYITTKIDDKASRAHNLARLEMALSRLEFALERVRRMPITYISLIRSWNMFRRAYKDGVHLLNKHTLQALEGHEGAGQVVVRGSFSSYLQRIARAARLFSISSLAGLMNKECLSSSDVQIFESYADGAEKFVTDVESVCPLRRDTFFPYPFVRHLLEGKTLRHERIVQGRQRLMFQISPSISEGRGVEACLVCECFDPERLDKNFSVSLMLRLSESTDIVGTAIDCVRSSGSLQNLVAQDAIIRELALLSNLQYNISSSNDPSIVAWYASIISSFLRPDPLCCQANGHVRSTMSSELSQIFQEQIIYFKFSCHIPALQYSLPSASDEAGRNVVMTDLPPLKLTVFFAPHFFWSGDGWVNAAMGDKYERRPFGNIQQTVDMVRSRSVDCLINQPETRKCRVSWQSGHGSAFFDVEKPSTGMAAGPKGRGRYNTRSAGKRKRT